MMRYIMSYGVALVLILLIAGWLASGTLIEGGQGPAKGEREIISLIEPQNKGPVHSLFTAIGLIKDDGEPAGKDVASNLNAPQNSAPATEPTPETQKLQTVLFKNFSAQLMPVEVKVVRGQTEASAKISVRAETSGIIKQINVSKGQQVKPGDLLCRLDKGTREAKLAQAEASLAQARASLAQTQADFDTNLALRNKGLAPANTARRFEVSLSAAKAAVRAGVAALDDIKKDLANTMVRTQIAGVVQAPLANEGDMLSIGAVCASIVKLDPMLFTGKVAEAKISLVKTGMPASVTTVTGQTVTGKVKYVSASADRATRSFQVEIELDNSGRQLLDGVSAAATIKVGAIKAQLIPQSALTLETDGTLGVRILNGDIVSFRSVKIVGDEAGGVWVAGLGQQVKIITLGQEYVEDGQKVLAKPANAGTQS
ncbi:hypothetical protein MNBD_ALPHA12-1349 [hydrothermal vent metagenome]|uniref:RND efflux pump membrane fusion protein barrel-sandwich domain-containing protein n=1 Tax=hydrothermal vent metagenome TaxID=652676 RepID=A0A3B0U1Q3_9ZZZZ